MQVAEDPQEGTQLQLPHLKGQAVEEMLNAVYRRYCGWVYSLCGGRCGLVGFSRCFVRRVPYTDATC
jgi:hypothetical protein